MSQFLLLFCFDVSNNKEVQVLMSQFLLLFISINVKIHLNKSDFMINTIIVIIHVGTKLL